MAVLVLFLGVVSPIQILVAQSGLLGLWQVFLPALGVVLIIVSCLTALWILQLKPAATTFIPVVGTLYLCLVIASLRGVDARNVNLSELLVLAGLVVAGGPYYRWRMNAVRQKRE